MGRMVDKSKKHKCEAINMQMGFFEGWETNLLMARYYARENDLILHISLMAFLPSFHQASKL